MLKLFADRENFHFNYPNSDFLTLNEHNFHNKIESISDKLKNQIVSYVTDAGMPSISDPGQQLIEYCQLNSINYDVFTGANSLTTAYVASGFKDVQFIFNGFLPKIGKKRVTHIKEIMNNPYNTIIYESPLRVINLIKEIVKIDENRTLFITKELTKKFQFYKKDSALNILKELESLTIKGEWIIIVHKPQDFYFNKIEYSDLIDLNIAPKIKAKLLSKIGKEDTQYYYNKIINFEKI